MDDEILIHRMLQNPAIVLYFKVCAGLFFGAIIAYWSVLAEGERVAKEK